MKSSLLISFEGIDGSGKSTQAILLKQKLEASGFHVLMCREPGGTPVSEGVRNLLLDPSLEIGPFAELLLFSAARAELVRTVIQPALAEGTIVILDRFYDSTVAYQGAGRRLADRDWLNDFNQRVTSGLQPDKTFLIRVSTETAADRMKEQPLDRMELTGREFFERVVDAYDAISREYPDRVVSLDGTLAKEKIHDIVWHHVSRLLPDDGTAFRSASNAIADTGGS
ncbi:MAG: dTMP kinase [Rhodothermales bacterium]|nr:dTMP kinase [Rhodothermales bacterium]